RLLIATDLFGNHEKPASFPIIMITFAAAVQHPGASYRLSGETKPILLHSYPKLFNAIRRQRYKLFLTSPRFFTKNCK
ncbi:MAG: hypothetical protein SOZ58_06600, partial [Prevotella sp.]|nr:hypothetical protein [Prevotella sp.]